MTRAEKARVRSREWEKAHPDQVRRRRQQPKYKEAQAARSRRWYLANTELAKTRMLEWERAHPIVKRERTRRRRARLREATVEQVDYETILKRDGHHCYLCDSAVEPGDIDFDHVIPLARGGEHAATNIRVTHARCNRKKGARLIPDLGWVTPTAYDAYAIARAVRHLNQQAIEGGRAA